MKALRETISDTRARLTHAKAAGGPAKTFTIHDGEALASPDTPPQSFYELTANANLPSLTAIRIEVPPLNPELARHTPENGFIVDKVQGWVIAPSGQKSPLAFRYFVQDSERNLQAALFSESDSEAKRKGNGARSERICRSSQALPDSLDRLAFSLTLCRWPMGAASRST